MSDGGGEQSALAGLLTRMGEALEATQAELREVKHGQAALLAELRVEIASLRGELAHYHASVVARGET